MIQQNQQSIRFKNILKHLHIGQLLLMYNRHINSLEVLDFVLENDFELLLNQLLSDRSNHYLSGAYIGSKLAKHNSVRCLKMLFATYRHDDMGMLKKTIKQAILRATEINNWYFLNNIVAYLIINDIDYGPVIKSLIAYSNMYDTALFILDQYKKYNKVLRFGEFDWTDLCKIYNHNEELVVELVARLHNANAELDPIYIDEYELPITDAKALSFVRLMFSKITMSKVKTTDIFKITIDKGYNTTAQFIYSQILDEDLPGLITNSIITDDVKSIKFINSISKFGEEYAYLCDLCVIHSALCCLRYLIEQCNLRPSASTYNLSLNNSKTKLYSDYLKAYL
jgi:hypothetical protein